MIVAANFLSNVLIFIHIDWGIVRNDYFEGRIQPLKPLPPQSLTPGPGPSLHSRRSSR